MKQISDSDHALLVEKLPRVLAAVRCSPSDTRTINAARRLKALSRKLSNKHPNPKKQHNNGTVD